MEVKKSIGFATENNKKIIVDILLKMFYFMISRYFDIVLLKKEANIMPDMLTVSTKGQITLPIGLRTEYGIEAGDKIFGEMTDIGYVIKRPKKGLLDYKGFIKDSYDPKKDLALAVEAASVHVMGEDEC